MKLESIYIGVLVGLLVCGGTFGIIFLFASFAQATTDITKWGIGFRTMVGVLGGIASFCLGTFCGADVAENMEGK